MRCLRYAGPGAGGDPGGDVRGGRDLRLDLIRGYAIFAMSVNHFSSDASALRWVTGGAAFLISAAEVFFFVSGLTLGVVSRRRVSASGDGLGSAVRRCYRRAWEVYLSVLTLAFGGAMLGLAVEDGEPFWELASGVLTLQWAPNWGDVLVAYVVYLLLVPVFLSLLAVRMTWVAVAVIAVVYGLSQADPGGLSLPVASFRNLAANAPLFLGGLVLGWHRGRVSGWWASRRLSGPVDLVIAMLGLFGLVMHAAGYVWWPALGEWLVRYELGVREYQMPAGALVVVAVYLRCVWLMVDRFWLVFRLSLGWFVFLFGRRALTGYVMHAFMMPVTWWAVEASGLVVEEDWRVGATVVSLVYVVLLWVSVWLVGAVSTLSARLAARRGSHGASGDRIGLPVGVHPGLVAVLAVGYWIAGPVSGGERREGWWDDEREVVEWELSEQIYGELTRFDGDPGAVIVRPMAMRWDEDAGEVWVEASGWAAAIAEVVEAERGGVSGVRRVEFVEIGGEVWDPLVDAGELASALEEVGFSGFAIGESAGLGGGAQDGRVDVYVAGVVVEGWIDGGWVERVVRVVGDRRAISESAIWLIGVRWMEGD